MTESTASSSSDTLLAQPDTLDWAKTDGLLPAIVQHARTGEVLMLGYMNRESLEHSIETGQVTFYSRSRQRLWTKGESSGHVLQLVSARTDCDRDAILVQALPQGPTCHLGTRSCFGESPGPALSMLGRLADIIDARAAEDAESSYTAKLLAEGPNRCAQKVGEEGVEVALAAVSGPVEDLNNEAADLLYHLLVCLKSAGSDLETVMSVLQQRHRPKP
ncbi:MAG: bifunctional phosphoribosyl-AMP cyclohydrolase/phosphoribosyl-ATP diphosphatase HisIE [Wenzhouxiangella sp.]